MPVEPSRRVNLANARVFDGEREHVHAVVQIAGGRIAGVGTADDLPAADETIDLDGLILAPGFVDVQVNGGGGVLFNAAATVEGLRAIAAAHRRFGTTSLLPTLISDDWPVMTAAADAVREALGTGVPGIRGIHFEGPYLNAERRGVHRAEAIRPPDADARPLLSAGDLGRVLVTLAPEVVPAGFIRALAETGVRISLGHSAADYDTVRAALDAGATGFTHLFNAMPPLSGRAPGVLGAALADPRSWCGVIADGHHVHPANLRLALACKPTGRVMLVTDAMPCVGSGAATFELDGRSVTVADGRCTTTDGTLAGSALDMASAVRNAVTLLDVPLAEALRMASLYPARFLGLDDRIGRIAPGCDADLVAFDDGLAVKATWIAGTRQTYEDA